MRILIASDKPVVNYENALRNLEVDFQSALDDINYDEFDGLVLPGGGDINPKFYGEEDNGTEEYDTDFDLRQMKVLRVFVERGKPVLGICRGMQLINVFFGGSLYQHIPYHRTGTRQDAHHQVVNVRGSIFSEIYSDTCTVNSSHHQAVKKIADDFIIQQVSNDGIVEGMIHRNLPIIAVQYHPERMAFDFLQNGVADGAMVFKSFLELI